MKSPIEKKLRDQLRRGHAGIYLLDYTDGPTPIGITAEKDPHWDVSQVGDVDPLECHVEEVHGFYAEASLFADVPLLSYRADLYLVTDGHALVIECDGHDFHDRTKQQAAYDRSRDRELLKLDIATIRFTGSEIHHSTDRCAADVWDIVKAFSERTARDQLTFRRGVECGVRQAADGRGIAAGSI